MTDSKKNIEIINSIGRKITSSLNLDEVVKSLYDYICTLMDVTDFIVYIYNPSSRSMEAKYKQGKHQNAMTDLIHIDSENSFCVYCMKNKKEVFINDIRKEYSKYIPSFYWESNPDEEIIHSFINIPLILEEKAFGVIGVQSFNKNSYTSEHVEILKSLASYMAIACNNADTYSQLNSAKEKLHRQNRIIEEKNKDITDSLNYAKRIQQAKLPAKELIYAHLPKSFVLFKPKDIVSGDFYFFHLKHQSVFIAAADCTGHGVPGALMSMIGSDKLEDAVEQSSNPSEILFLLNKGIKISLKQNEKDNESTRDGMDIALCSVDVVNRIVKYVGANRPIWIIRNGRNFIEEIKATKKAIGGFTEDKQYFDTHEIQLQKGDTFYISTDGYADTFGGKEEKKVTTKRFKEILISIQDKTMQEQEKHLDDFIENWKKGEEQIDDILVIGVRL